MQRVHSLFIGENKMTRPVPRRQRDRRGIIGRERAVLDIELPNKDLVQRQVGYQNESARRISLHHMRVRSAVVAENGKVPARGAGRINWPHRAPILFDVGGGTQITVRPNGKYCRRPAGEVGHQQVFARRVDAQAARAGSL